MRYIYILIVFLILKMLSGSWFESYFNASISVPSEREIIDQD